MLHLVAVVHSNNFIAISFGSTLLTFWSTFVKLQKVLRIKVYPSAVYGYQNDYNNSHVYL